MMTRFKNGVQQLWSGEHAAQIVEFAVTLPLLMVFVVGIFDFSSAFTLKQKLTNVARTAARAAAADPASDLQMSMPMSVNNAFQIVDKYLRDNNINECGIDVTLYTQGPKTYPNFTFTGTNCTQGTLTIVINRGYYFPADTTATPANANCSPQSVGSTQTAVVATCVSIQYPYAWQFGRVASLLGYVTTLPTTINATAVEMNEN
jgi:Flp pilus assembly protein TadG